MLHRTLFISLLTLLAGCAGTKQATVEPAVVGTGAASTTRQAAEASPVSAAEALALTAPAASPSTSAEAQMEPSPALEVTDATRSDTVPPPARPASNPFSDPYQCMLAWAKGIQDALQPLAHTAQACDTRTGQP